MTLTASQLTDLQTDVGVSDDELVFTDAELNRLYERAESDYATAVVYALRQLLMNAAKRADYTQNASSESRSQVFTHLKQMLEHWEAIAGLGGGVIRAGVIDLDLDADEDDLNAELQ